MNGDWKREVFDKKKTRKHTARERTQGPCKETVRLVTQGLFEEHSQGKDTKTFEGAEATRRRNGEFRKMEEREVEEEEEKEKKKEAAKNRKRRR